MQSKNQMVIVNQTNNLPTFSVSATTNNSNQQLNYQWYSNTTNSNNDGTLIPGANSSSYQVTKSDVLTPQSKYFYVKVTGTINGIKLTPVVSDTVNLIVSVLPRIVIQKQPISQTVTIGEPNLPTFSISVNNISNAELKYQWYSTTNTSGSNKDWHIINGANSSSYTVSSSDVERTGSTHYYVEISGTLNGLKLGSINSSVGTLRVNALPAITVITQPQSSSVFIGQKNDLPTLSITTNNINNAKLKYQWYSTTNTSGSNNDWHIINGANSSSYTIPVSDTEVVGPKHYYVGISGTINGLKLRPINSGVGTLMVNALPKITISNQPKNLEAFVGQTIDLAAFSVSVNNINGSQLNYQWYESNTNSTTDGTAIVGATNSTYKITESDIKTVGSKYYYVKISGTFNGLSLTPVNSSPATLKVNALPAISINTQPQDAKVFSNQVGDLPIFSVAANPLEGVAFTYQWYKNTNNSTNNGQEIKNATGKSYQVRKSDFTNIKKIYFYVKISGNIKGSLLTPIYSRVITLIVEDLPTVTITSQPKDQSYYVNEQNQSLPVFTVAARASNSGVKLKYQWYKKNLNEIGSVAQMIYGANSSSYTVPRSDIYTDPGTLTRISYYCKISGSFKGTNIQPVNSNSAILNIVSTGFLK